jgi:hypothetical protein
MHSMPPGTSTNLMWQTDLFVQNNQKTKVTLLRESTTFCCPILLKQSL